MSYRIIKKQELAKSIKSIVVEAPLVCLNAEPGQFVMVMASQNGERIPLTLADTDKVNGLITLIFQEIGFTTKNLGALGEGDSIFSILGPLGNTKNKTHLEKIDNTICIGGGVGIAEIYPISKMFKEAGKKVFGIIGARSKEFLILEDKMRVVSDKLFITTDDGSYGRKGFVTDVLKELIETKEERRGAKSIVYAIGPVPMMAKVAEITKPYKIKTIVSLNPIMVDATGMCGSCRVSVSGQTKFGCVDGPEFDAHEVNFKELMQRLDFFKEEEKCVNERCPKK